MSDYSHGAPLRKQKLQARTGFLALWRGHAVFLKLPETPMHPACGLVSERVSAGSGASSGTPMKDRSAATLAAKLMLARPISRARRSSCCMMLHVAGETEAWGCRGRTAIYITQRHPVLSLAVFLSSTGRSIRIMFLNVVCCVFLMVHHDCTNQSHHTLVKIWARSRDNAVPHHPLC